MPKASPLAQASPPAPVTASSLAVPPPGLMPPSRRPLIIALIVLACGTAVGLALCGSEDSTPDTPRHAF